MTGDRARPGDRFTEADGTTYAPTLRTGRVEVGGVTLAIDGPRGRGYRIVAG